jgi:hypothetical protein
MGLPRRKKIVRQQKTLQRREYNTRAAVEVNNENEVFRCKVVLAGDRVTRRVCKKSPKM